MTTPLPENFVRLAEGQMVELHFTDHAIAPRTIVDPVTQLAKEVTTLTFVVDEEGGRPVAKTYSITSNQHMQDFGPYLEGRRYRDYTWVITARGSGFLRRYVTIRLPRPSAGGSPPPA